MNISQDKTISLSEAVTKFVFSGCHLSIGGFTASRNPMAAVYEIIRQKISNIHLYEHSNGQGVDELIGAGACPGWRSPTPELADSPQLASDLKKPPNPEPLPSKIIPIIR